MDATHFVSRSPSSQATDASAFKPVDSVLPQSHIIMPSSNHAMLRFLIVSSKHNIWCESSPKASTEQAGDEYAREPCQVAHLGDNKVR
jgi:hypothetical protein